MERNEGSTQAIGHDYGTKDFDEEKWYQCKKCGFLVHGSRTECLDPYVKAYFHGRAGTSPSPMTCEEIQVWKVSKL